MMRKAEVPPKIGDDVCVRMPAGTLNAGKTIRTDLKRSVEVVAWLSAARPHVAPETPYFFSRAAPPRKQFLIDPRTTGQKIA